jgi:hypothetical protein
VSVDERFRRSVPWRLPDLYLGVALAAVGTIFLGVATVGVAGRDDLADQVPWVNLGVGGLIVLCLGCVLWVLAGMRATAELRRTVLGRLRATLDAGDRTPPAAVADTVAGDGFVSAPTMTRYHRAGCQLVAGKDVAPLDAERNGRQPCSMCVAGADS